MSTKGSYRHKLQNPVYKKGGETYYFGHPSPNHTGLVAWQPYLELLLQEWQELLSHELVAEGFGEGTYIAAEKERVGNGSTVRYKTLAGCRRVIESQLELQIESATTITARQRARGNNLRPTLDPEKAYRS